VSSKRTVSQQRSQVVHGDVPLFFMLSLGIILLIVGIIAVTVCWVVKTVYASDEEGRAILK